MFAVHFANVLDVTLVMGVRLATMLALCTSAVLGMHFFGFMLRITMVVFHGLHVQVHFGFVDALFSGFNFAAGLAVLFGVMSVMFSGVVRHTAMLVVMCLMTFHRSTP